MMHRITPYLTIIRPLNALISFLSPMLILVISDASEDEVAWGIALLSGIVAAFVCAGANVINDIFDLEIDRINKPHRVIASGAMSLMAARRYYVFLTGSAVILSAWINWAVFGIVVFSVLLLYYYSVYLKRTPIWGNLTVCFFTSVNFLAGGMAFDQTEHAWYPALFTFLFQFGRELLKDVEDIEGDRVGGANTFPVLYGVRASLLIVTLSFIILSIAMYWPYHTGFYGKWYALIVLIGLMPLIVAVTFMMWRDTSALKIRRLNQLLKLAMFIGLFAIYNG